HHVDQKLFGLYKYLVYTSIGSEVGEGDDGRAPRDGGRGRGVVRRAAAHGAPDQGPAASHAGRRRRIGNLLAAARGAVGRAVARQRTGDQRAVGPVDGQP